MRRRLRQAPFPCARRSDHQREEFAPTIALRYDGTRETRYLDSRARTTTRAAPAEGTPPNEIERQ